MATSLNVSYVPVTFKVLGGGLNTTSGPLGLAEEESSDLQNVEFNKFGSVLQRNGYTVLNNNILTGTAQGLYWYNAPSDQYAVTVNQGSIYKMDNLDGTWDNISGAVTLGGTLDSYTKLLLHCDGADQGTTFTDSEATPKTVTNTETYDSYTVLMLHCNGTAGSTTITDSSLGTHTVTAVVSAQLDTAQYEFTTASLVLTGSSYCTIPDSDDWNFSSSDFTVDFWVRFNNTSGLQRFITQEQGGNEIVFSKETDPNNRLLFYGNSGGATTAEFQMTNPWGPSTNTWYHIAFVRSGSTPYIFINGTSQAITTNVPFGYMPNVGAALEIGRESAGGGGAYVNGWMDEVRISKGIARWTTDFKVPTSPYGQVSMTTSYLKFGSAGGEFKGYERLSLADHADWSFGTGDFTLSFWVNFNQLAPQQTFLGQYENATNYWFVRKNSSTSSNSLHMQFMTTGTTTGEAITGTWSVLANQWYHLTFIRSSTSAVIYVNGVSQTLNSSTSFATSDVGNMAAPLVIGQQNNASFYNGYMDEMRVSKGIARWTADFTPPDAEYGGYHKQDFDTFMNFVIGVDPANGPWTWNEDNGTASNLTTLSGLQGAKFIKKYQNYLFMANITISQVRYPSRVYWSDILSITSWQSYNYIDISRNDGDEISGIKELGDRLVVYKRNSIYVIIFTGDGDIPFVVQRTNSAVGCVAPFSIQTVENGHVFCAYDGIYYFDGSNSYKMSDKITDTFKGLNFTSIQESSSLYEQINNRYLLSVPSGTSIYNNFILGWNSYLNSWTKYTGMSASCLATFLVNNVEERPYFSDYLGYTYRMDNGVNDYPTGTKTAIDSYWYSNWKSYDTLCDKKGVPHIYLALRNETSTILTLNYAYDFFNGAQYSHTFSAVSTMSVTSHTMRRDLIGRGRFVRIGFAHNATDTSYRLDGLGTFVTREGMA